MSVNVFAVLLTPAEKQKADADADHAWGECWFHQYFPDFRTTIICDAKYWNPDNDYLDGKLFLEYQTQLENACQTDHDRLALFRNLAKLNAPDHVVKQLRIFLWTE